MHKLDAKFTKSLEYVVLFRKVLLYLQIYNVGIKIRYDFFLFEFHVAAIL